MSAGEGTYGPLDFARDSEVPRETLERLTNYSRLLVERNAHLNLVADSTLPDMWRRHFWDSAQLVPLVPAGVRTIVDIGSGAGFPGMVLAIVLGEAQKAPSTAAARRSPSPAKAVEDRARLSSSSTALAGEVASSRRGQPLTVHLIDSTQKKCRFLEEVAAATGAPVKVHWSRAEDLAGLKADVVTARAVAPLTKLLGLAHPFFTEGTTGLFLKGRAAAAELTEAAESWRLHVETFQSRTDPSGSILRVTGLMPWRKRKPS